MLFFPAKQKSKIVLFNTASKTKELFEPSRKNRVGLYSCGPTVYNYPTIGNLRSYVFSDTIRRVFEYAGYTVKHVINVTDFGHLVGDADDTEDKMTIALRREGKEFTMENMRVVADRYTRAFVEDMHELNIKPPHVLPRASEHVRGMAAYVETLLHKGFAYATSDGVYFDTAKFPSYGALGGSASAEYSRTGVASQKKNPRDFALWKFNTTLGWDAPWGKGFPGWHIECTAMSTHYLGKTFDIHTGGIDHITIHHNNEIAQAEAANGKPYARYWLHNEFITIDGKRIGKSEGNTITLAQLRDRGISSLAYRYWLLTGHYRQKMNFTWEAVEAAQTALQRAWMLYAEFPDQAGTVVEKYRKQFEQAIFDDLNTPEAVAVLWSVLKDETIEPADKRLTIRLFDTVLGIGFGEAASRKRLVSVSVVSKNDIPEEVERLLNEREAARKRKDYVAADQLRDQIRAAGFLVEDSSKGPVLKRM